MITTFFFDLGGVLFTNGTKKFIKQISSAYNISENKIKNVIDADGKLISLYAESKITRDEFWKQVISTLKLREDADTLKKQWIDGYELIFETKKLIKRLSRKYKIYYLSDNMEKRMDTLNKKFNFLKLFKGGIFSHEVRVRKPNLQIYKLALIKSGSKPKETIFIDDKQMMLDPAKALGIKTILFTTPKKLEKIFLKEKFI